MEQKNKTILKKSRAGREGERNGKETYNHLEKTTGSEGRREKWKRKVKPF